MSDYNKELINLRSVSGEKDFVDFIVKKSYLSPTSWKRWFDYQGNLLVFDKSFSLAKGAKSKGLPPFIKSHSNIYSDVKLAQSCLIVIKKDTIDLILNGGNWVKLWRYQGEEWKGHSVLKTSIQLIRKLFEFDEFYDEYKELIIKKNIINKYDFDILSLWVSELPFTQKLFESINEKENFMDIENILGDLVNGW